jgi:putative transposase
MNIYRFKIFPNERQKEYIDNNMYCYWFVYNHWLEKRTNYYHETKKNFGLAKCSEELTELKHTEQYKFLEDADSTVLQQALVDLNNDFKVFFKKRTKASYPKFKRKDEALYCKIEKKENSSNIYFTDGYVKIPKISKIKLADDEEVPENIKINFAILSKTLDDEYYITII